MPVRRKLLLAVLTLGLLAPARGVRAGFTGTDVFIPASARAAGVAPAQFYSTLWLTNLSSSAVANVQLKYFQRDTSNTSPVTVPVTVNPGETKKYENVVQTVFGLSGASGAIRVQSDQEILASSRTYNLPPGADIKDSNGLFFAGIPRALAIGSGESSQLQGVSQGGSENFRYNFGLVETAGASATVRVVVRAADGSALGTKDYTVRPFEAKQYAVTDPVPGIAAVNARIDASVVAGGGRVLLYGTGIANGSQDSIGVEMSFRSSLLTTTGVTSLNGLAGALTLTAGNGISLSTLGGSSLEISAVGAGLGLGLPYTGTASTTGVTGAFAVGNTGTGPAIVATSAGAVAISGSVPGNGSGVYGQSAGGVGVLGSATAGAGVKGLEGAGSGLTVGSGRAGVLGDAADGAGLLGASAGDTGVIGASATKYGVQALGYADGNAAAAFFSYSYGATAPVAAYFARGSVTVNGSLSKASGSFKIDHPLDPENAYLYHSFVESPDMKNIYDGVVVLDARGEAVVPLPRWFSALNRDFRYQLTCIGGHAPVYIAREIEGDAFAIAGGRPGLKVSWQVTGIRQDAWANAHRVPVEEQKDAAERGSYLHPELFGQPEERGVEWALNPGLMRELRQNRERLEAARRKTSGN